MTSTTIPEIIVIDDNSCSEDEGAATRKPTSQMDHTSRKIARTLLADGAYDSSTARVSAINWVGHHEDVDRRIALQMQNKEDDNERKGARKRKRLEKCDEEFARKLQKEEDKKLLYNEDFHSSSFSPLASMPMPNLRKELERHGVATSEMVEREELVTASETFRATKLEIVIGRHEQEHEHDLALARYIQEEEHRNNSLHFSKHRTKELVLASLESCQLVAVNYVKSQAKTMHEKALPNLEARVQMFGGYTKEDLMECLNYIRDEAPVIIHMKEATLALLVKDTHYRNQFETNTSGGSMNHLSRVKWEKAMFGSCYDGVDGRLRVKYGCLNVSGDIAGVKSARCYGPLFMVLQPHVRHRTTFFNQDTGNAFSSACHHSSSSATTTALATNDYYAHILNCYSNTDLMAVINVCRSARVGGARSHCTSYKEVQIHGPVCLATDVQALSIPGRQKNASKKLLEDAEKFRIKTDCNILWQEDLLNPEN